MSIPETSPRAVPARTFLLPALAGVLALTALMFNRVVFAGEWLSSRDTVRVYMPLAKYWADRVRQGEWPEWYPYDSLGQPFIALMFSAAFHPTKLLYLLLPVEHALSVNTLICYPAAAFGTYGCARLWGASREGALFAGISFAFSGYLVGISNNLAYLMAIATMPWAFWAAERFYRAPSAARALVAAGILATICFAGETQTFALCGGGVTLLGAVRGGRPLSARVALSLAITVPALLLSAPQILPALDGLRTREGLNPLTMAQSFSLHPIRLFEFAFGPVFISENVGFISEELGAIVDPKMNSTWVDSVALGMPALALAAVSVWSARNRRAAVLFAAGAGFILLLAMGRYAPVYALVYRFVPVWNVFRYPEKLAPWFGFIIALAAGVTISRAMADDAFRRRAVIGLMFGAAVCAVSAGVAGGLNGLNGWHGLLMLAGVAEATWPPLTRWFVLNAGGTALCTCLLALALWRLPRRVAGVVLIAGQAALLLWYGLPLPQTVGLPLVREPSGFTPTLLSMGLGKLGGGRVHGGSSIHAIPESGLGVQETVAFGMFAQLEPNLPALFGMEATNYYMPAGSARIVRTIREGNTGGRWLVDFPALYGAEYMVLDRAKGAALLRSGLFEVVEENIPWGQLLVRARHVRPRVFVVSPQCVQDPSSGVQRLQSPGFRTDLEAVVECAGAAPATDPAARPATVGAAELRHYSAERVEVDVDAADGSLLVLNDAYYDGWTATLNGSPVTIAPANVAVRGVRLPAGSHRVRFTYRQGGLRLGLLIATGTILGFAAAALLQRRRTSRR